MTIDTTALQMQLKSEFAASIKNVMLTAEEADIVEHSTAGIATFTNKALVDTGSALDLDKQIIGIYSSALLQVAAAKGTDAAAAADKIRNSITNFATIALQTLEAAAMKSLAAALVTITIAA